MKIEKLINNLLTWFKETVVASRLKNSDVGYNWVYKDIECKKLGLKELQEHFDRKEQNNEYDKRYKETKPEAKKQYAWYQNEVNMIYSFHKCFAMRNQTRIQYIRNDLSQKGKRTRFATNAAIGKFVALRELSEQKL